MNGIRFRCDNCGAEYKADTREEMKDFKCEVCGSELLDVESSVQRVVASNELSRGIFWVLADTAEELDTAEIFHLPIYCDRNGYTDKHENLNAKSGDNYNHKLTWQMLDKSITRGKPFDYYPRGRVEISRDKATIWLNGNIVHRVNDIKKLFGLNGKQITRVDIKEDGSAHYKCHLDKDSLYE